MGEQGQDGALGEGEMSLQLTADGQAVPDGPVVVGREKEVDARVFSSVPKDDEAEHVATHLVQALEEVGLRASLSPSAL